MAQKFLNVVSGVLTQLEANNSSAGAGDAGKLVALDDNGKIDSSMMPVGIGSESDTATATEDIAAGDFVNLYASSGLKVRKADATTAGKEANGFALASISNTASGTIYRPTQSNNQVSGLTAGTKYYLSTTAGGVTATAPSSSGNVVQVLGVATATSAISFFPSDPITLA